MSSIHACWLNTGSGVKKVLQKMLEASEYWQPDSVSDWLSQGTAIGLAKAQLFNTARSIDDATYFFSQQGVAICANARIDNRTELLRLLGFGKNDSEIKTDAHLIIQCYLRWKEDCPTRLRGDFVFIIWDEKRQKIFCARDHFGVKVLFYSQDEQGIMVTNEHNAFFTSGWVDQNQINESWLVKRLWNLEELSFESPNSKIQVLPPAHLLEIDRKGVRLKCYWKLKSKKCWNSLSDNELIEELKLRFERSVSARLDSRYPLGAELSAGLDSNGIVGYAARQFKEQTLYTFSHQCTALTKENRHVWNDVYLDIQTIYKLHSNITPVWEEASENSMLETGWPDKLLCDKKEFYRCFGGVIPNHGFHFVRSKL
ncbi:MAG: asparagine synthase-related protein, partial [Kangiellaceae bacterium]|nr:asparagine synthase-related protein [Kangiellaceae bacterium]